MIKGLKVKANVDETSTFVILAKEGIDVALLCSKWLPIFMGMTVVIVGRFFLS